MGRDTDVWLSWNANGILEKADYDYYLSEFIFVGRLNNNFSVAQAQQILSATINEFRKNNATLNGSSGKWNSQVKLTSAKSTILGSVEYIVILLVAVVGLLLITYCFY